ncbi:energy-coupling factor transporter transmembrane component T family protein [Mannheimia massilioguelmaensis]|uniref:energy-coupling factor transporter transmembrane component T family protein n=1 Tax=Mannheimia massilioguelmaensis TaxID=1604354 RepID=UPI0005C8DEE1|nr:energy-coupling factor transporter transmembrane component T [Mannheimia massilioguelmaensis]
MMKLAFFTPHVRLLYAFGIGLIISAITDIPMLAWLTCIAYTALLLFLYVNQQSIVPYIKRWLSLNIFTLLLWLTLTWQVSNSGIDFSPLGIHTALLITFRMNLIFCSLCLLLYGINDVRLVQAISQLPLPNKFIQLFILTVRYISLLAEENRRISIAMQARGFQAKCNWRTFQVLAQRVALLLVRALIKVEVVEMALRARGFKFQSQSSLLEKTWWKYVEIFTALLAIAWIIK